jgi:hypothetical protein
MTTDTQGETSSLHRISGMGALGANQICISSLNITERPEVSWIAFACYQKVSIKRQILAVALKSISVDSIAGRVFSKTEQPVHVRPTQFEDAQFQMPLLLTRLLSLK